MINKLNNDKSNKKIRTMRDLQNQNMKTRSTNKRSKKLKNITIKTPPIKYQTKENK